MTDAVWIALITGFFTAAPPTIVALLAWHASVKNGKKVDATQEDVKSIKQAAERTPKELDLMATGAHWKGYEEGVMTERKRTTDFGKLQPDDWRG